MRQDIERKKKREVIRSNNGRKIWYVKEERQETRKESNELGKR